MQKEGLAMDVFDSGSAFVQLLKSGQKKSSASCSVYSIALAVKVAFFMW